MTNKGLYIKGLNQSAAMCKYCHEWYMYIIIEQQSEHRLSGICFECFMERKYKE